MKVLLYLCLLYCCLFCEDTDLITRSLSSKQLHAFVIIGTRPECIKLAPVIRLISDNSNIKLTVIFSGQHADLIKPFLSFFRIKVDKVLSVITTRGSNETF